MSHKADFDITSINTDKKSHFIMIKVILYQENITTLNVYASNNRATIL